MVDDLNEPDDNEARADPGRIQTRLQHAHNAAIAVAVPTEIPEKTRNGRQGIIAVLSVYSKVRRMMFPLNAR